MRELLEQAIPLTCKTVFVYNEPEWVCSIRHGEGDTITQVTGRGARPDSALKNAILELCWLAVTPKITLTGCQAGDHKWQDNYHKGVFNQYCSRCGIARPIEL